MSRRENAGWSLLPIEGSKLIRIEFSGNGRRSELCVATEQHEPFVIPLSFATWELSSAVPLVTTTTAFGDVEVRTTFAPPAGTRAVLAQARVISPSLEEDLFSGPTTSRDDSRKLQVCVEARLCLARGT